jgi:hypothetical protein
MLHMISTLDHSNNPSSDRARKADRPSQLAGQSLVGKKSNSNIRIRV